MTDEVGQEALKVAAAMVRAQVRALSGESTQRDATESGTLDLAFARDPLAVVRAVTHFAASTMFAVGEATGTDPLVFFEAMATRLGVGEGDA